MGKYNLSASRRDDVNTMRKFRWGINNKKIYIKLFNFLSLMLACRTNGVNKKPI